MSTADEMRARWAAAAPALAVLHYAADKMLRETAAHASWLLCSRVVHGQRARRLRRRGMDVRRWGCTSTGKPRYRWAEPAIRITA